MEGFSRRVEGKHWDLSLLTVHHQRVARSPCGCSLLDSYTVLVALELDVQHPVVDDITGFTQGYNTLYWDTYCWGGCLRMPVNRINEPQKPYSCSPAFSLL